MRKTSQNFNSNIVIQNIWELCGEDMAVDELPYWETINKYLEKLKPQELQDIIHELVKSSYAAGHLRKQESGKNWQVIIDGTQIYSSRKELDEKSLFRVHNRGTEKGYTEYYYVLKAKRVLGPNILVSIMTEFVENTDGKEAEKQDCERKACYRLMDRLKKEFPHLPVCLSADSLYACENFFKKCQENGWHYMIRFKEGSIPVIADEFEKLKKIEGNRREQKLREGICWHDFITGIYYDGYRINMVGYVKEKKMEMKRGPGKGKKIENEGFNTQKRYGYHLEHLFSKNYQAIKNHYFLMQIGHMIAQVMEAWKKLWEKAGLDMREKHAQILESFRSIRLSEYRVETDEISIVIETERG